MARKVVCKDGKTRVYYNSKEKRDFHNKQAKKGATNGFGEPISDFKRGVHKQKADQAVRQMDNHYAEKDPVQHSLVKLYRQSKLDKLRLN